MFRQRHPPLANETKFNNIVYSGFIVLTCHIIANYKLAHIITFLWYKLLIFEPLFNLKKSLEVHVHPTLSWLVGYL
jgi:hypothetical protein